MSTLKNQFIADTFNAVLHTYGNPISAGNISQVFDGSGAVTALQVGLSGTGVNVNGQLSASGFKYPTSAPGGLSLLANNGTSLLALSTVGQIFSFLGGVLNGTYDNPTLTFNDGVISNAVSNVTGGLSAFTTPGTTSFIIPANVRKVKFTVTGGGGNGGDNSGYNGPGGAGGTIIGHMNVSPGAEYQVTVGSGGTNSSYVGGNSSISQNNATIVYATGGNSTNAAGFAQPVGGGTGVVSNGSVVSSIFIVPGGRGGHADFNANDRDSIGASSYWGNYPAYGGGGSKPGLADGGSGVVLIEW